jgi:hypothetical protein
MATVEVLKVNHTRTVHEVIDNEVIVIDLETGTYYNLEDTALEIWEAIQHGTTRQQLLDGFTERYSDPEPDRELVVAFVDELLTAGLVEVELTDTPPAGFNWTGAPPMRPFSKPVLGRHTMSDLLLLDPIHDVDERGWPHALPQ